MLKKNQANKKFNDPTPNKKKKHMQDDKKYFKTYDEIDQIDGEVAISARQP